MTGLSILILLIILTFFIGISVIIFLKKMNISKKIIRESIVILIISIFGEIIAGVFLTGIEELLPILPGLIVLIPVVSGTRGSIMGIFCSRLTSAVHLGTIKPAFNFKNKLLYENMLGTLFLTITVAIFAGILAHFVSAIFGFQSAGMLRFITIVLIASFASDIVLITTGTITTFIVYKKGYDPDNLLFPINTTISDAISSLFLVLAARIVI